MNKNSTELTQAIEKLQKNQNAANVGEHLVNLFKAGLATAPFCGGIASLLSDYIPSRKIKRLEEFTIQLAEILCTVQEKVDEECILTDDFAYVFQKCYEGVAKHHQKEKLSAYKGILLNCAINVDIESVEREYFLNLVDNFSALHIRILKFMHSPKEYLESMEISLENIRGGFSDFFPVAIPGVDLEAIKSAFEDLYNYGLINTQKGVFTTMTSGQGLHLLGNRVSNFGRKFIEFISFQNT